MASKLHTFEENEKQIQQMSEEERNHSQQGSGGKEGFGNIRLDRQKVHDFFLSLDSGEVKKKLTMDETGDQVTKEVIEDKSFTFFLPE